MKLANNPAATGGQTKAVTFLVACFACSLMLSMTVVTYVVRWLMTN